MRPEAISGTRGSLVVKADAASAAVSTEVTVDGVLFDETRELPAGEVAASSLSSPWFPSAAGGASEGGCDSPISA